VHVGGVMSITTYIHTTKIYTQANTINFSSEFEPAVDVLFNTSPSKYNPLCSYFLYVIPNEINGYIFVMWNHKIKLSIDIIKCYHDMSQNVIFTSLLIYLISSY
jgi:hypothetical protein